jgi:hypothetical protein
MAASIGAFGAQREHFQRAALTELDRQLTI